MYCWMLTVASSALASEIGDDPLHRWLPTFGLTFGLHYQEFDTSGRSDLGYSASETRTVLAPIFAFHGGLSTPAIASRFGAPRLYSRLAVQVPISDDYPLLRSTRSFAPLDPQTPAFCPLGGPLNKASCDQTIDATLTLRGNWAAGLGLEFLLPVEHLPYRLRAGIDYLGQNVELVGLTRRDDRTSGTAPGTSGTIVESFEIAGASTSRTLHSLGPRMEIEVEVARIRSVSLNLLLEVASYWIVNPETIEYGVSNSNGTSVFEVRPRSFIVQGGAGLRVVWMGSGDR
jgi:hypothetical protein